MTIICATDFSGQAEQASRIAARLCQRTGDGLLLVHVVEPLTVGYPELMIGPDALDKALAEAATKSLAQAAAELRTLGIPVETRILFGHPAEATATLAADLKARLIVLGTHGRGATARFLLGSVAERTVVAAACPVLVAREATGGFAEWVEGGRPLKVMVGLDASAASDAALAFVRDLRALGSCDVTFVHVYWPPQEYTRLGLHGPRDLFREDPDVVAVLDRELRARIGILPGKGEMSLRIRANWGRQGDAVATEAETDRSDLIVVGTHQRHGLARLWSGSAARATLQAAHRPVLCVPLRPEAGAGHGSAKALPPLRTVLCSTDFSELANAAIPHAYSLLSGRGGGVVELVHVYERPVPSPVYAYDSVKDALKPEHRAELEGKLRSLVPSEAEDFGITTHLSIVDGGAPGEAIVQIANRLGVDAIVLGTHGRTGVRKAVLGSVASEVVSKSPCPVYAVRAIAG